MTGIKVCGLTQAADAALAWELGAAALGFIFYPGSPRAVTIDEARSIRNSLPDSAYCVGVFVDETTATITETVDQVGLSAVQLHGTETPDQCAAITSVPVIKALSLHDNDSGAITPADYDVAAFLLDASHPTLRGGTGLQVDATAAAALDLHRPLILAGGLTPDNIHPAIDAVRPAAVDVNSGVETSPGIKDHADLRRLFTTHAPTNTPGGRPWLISA